MKVENVLDMIGNTPMVRLTPVSEGVEIWLKLEKYNPGGSVKDRIAKYMIENAERDGVLTRDKTVIEPTSGNTGIGLALVCAAKGYHLTLVMPETMTMERRQVMIALGAKVVLSDGSRGMDGAQDLAREIIEMDPGRYFMPDQFNNRYNVLAHYETTAEEIWRDSGGRVTHFVAGLGTTGTIMGVSKRLREHKPDVGVIAVQPCRDSPIPGLKNLDVQYVPGIWSPEGVDEVHEVHLREAEETALLFSMREGLFVGPSSGAIAKVALEKAMELDEGVIVAMAPDGGERYLTTTLCRPERCVECTRKFGIVCSYQDGQPITRI